MLFLTQKNVFNGLRKLIHFWTQWERQYWETLQSAASRARWPGFKSWPGHCLVVFREKKKKIASPSLSLFMEVRVTRRVYVSQRSFANKLLNRKDLEYRGSSINRFFIMLLCFLSLLCSLSWTYHSEVRNSVCGHKFYLSRKHLAIVTFFS